VHAFLDRPRRLAVSVAGRDIPEAARRRPDHLSGGDNRCRSKHRGKREIVGLHIGSSEGETFRSGPLKSLSRRGLRGVKLVISDAHEGPSRLAIGREPDFPAPLYLAIAGHEAVGKPIGGWEPAAPRVSEPAQKLSWARFNAILKSSRYRSDVYTAGAKRWYDQDTQQRSRMRKLHIRICEGRVKRSMPTVLRHADSV
jgi:hypothetical protein